MTTAKIRISIKQNNIAVSMIETARYNQAIYILKAAIQKFKNELRSEVVQEFHSEPCSAMIHHLILQSASGRIDNGDSSDESGFLYDKAVFIPQKVSLETHIAFNAVSSILLFNLALALQLKANATKADLSRKDSCFVNSMSMYQLVMALNGSSGLLSMVVLNNVGLIHREYKDHEKEKECFDRLLAMWRVSPVRAKDLEGMFYNAMRWHNTSALPAAAA
ncbi:MAG: hypothetical protein SGBAC_011437 [Bacillariaceae sp.]